jgi:hypothetical protein
MPPRLIVATIVAGWLATAGWFASEKWLPWLRTSDEPAFVVELADEVAPQQASWLLYRNHKRIGAAETRMAPRKDGTFELSTRLRDLELSYGVADVKMPVFNTTRTVTRNGDLLRLDARAVMIVRTRPLGVDLKTDATIRGEVTGDELRGECEYDYGSGKMKHSLGSIRLVSKNAFSPLQPFQKFPPLRPGQTWRVSNLDPVSDALDGALKQVIYKQFGLRLAVPEQPRELLAEVQTETEAVTHRGKTHTCRVIVYRAEKVTARTWVDVEDGKVVRQEATLMGETMALQRE